MCKNVSVKILLSSLCALSVIFISGCGRSLNNCGDLVARYEELQREGLKVGREMQEGTISLEQAQRREQEAMREIMDLQRKGAEMRCEEQGYRTREL